MTQFKTSCLHAQQAKRDLYVAVFPAHVLTEISYAARLRVDHEPGAVQRLLDTKRIVDLKRFALAGGDFSAGIILNWVSTDNPLTIENNTLSFEVGERLAQLVDGQHRVEGLRDAIRAESKVGNHEIPVVIYVGLTTTECADIFVSINDKQKPIPRSMIVDLYGVASELVVDPVSERARDLAEMLNNEDESPYHSLIRFANEPRSKFGIAVSTVNDNIKPLIEPQGLMNTVGLSELHMQKMCLFNYFSIFKRWYGKKWDEKSNIFLTSAGFVGAVDFLKFTMLPYCHLTDDDFTTVNMESAMRLDPDELIDKDAVKGKQGRASWNHVNEMLKSRYQPKNRSIRAPKL